MPVRKESLTTEYINLSKRARSFVFLPDLSSTKKLHLWVPEKTLGFGELAATEVNVSVELRGGQLCSMAPVCLCYPCIYRELRCELSPELSCNGVECIYFCDKFTAMISHDTFCSSECCEYVPQLSVPLRSHPALLRFSHWPKGHGNRDASETTRPCNIEHGIECVFSRRVRIEKTTPD